LQAKAVVETAAEWMLNKRVEIDPSGTATHEDLPTPDSDPLGDPA
jgi:hypothetical protein